MTTDSPDVPRIVVAERASFTEPPALTTSVSTVREALRGLPCFRMIQLAEELRERIVENGGPAVNRDKLLHALSETGTKIGGKRYE